MSLLKKLNKSILIAKKGGNMPRANALNLLKAELINNEKASKPKPELTVAQKYRKKLVKSLKFYGNDEKGRELRQEIEFIDEILPQEMSDEEVVKIIDMCFKVHDYEELTIGEVIGKLKNAINTSNGKLIADEVKKRMK